MITAFLHRVISSAIIVTEIASAELVSFQSIKFIFRSRCVKNEQMVQLTVIRMQGSHDHIKDH